MREFERTRYQCHIYAHNKCFNGDAKVMLFFLALLTSHLSTEKGQVSCAAKLDPAFKTAFKT